MKKEIGKGITIKKSFGHCCYEFKEDYVHIYDLFIFPKSRRMGNARRILQIAINRIKKIGYKGKIKIVAQPRGDSISLKNIVTFYKSMGLEVFSYYG